MVADNPRTSLETGATGEHDSGTTPHTDSAELAPERPLGSYAMLAAGYGITFAVPLIVAARRGALPRAPRARDLPLLTVATFKLSRLVAREAVTGFLRAPFVEYDGMESLATPRESPSGTGIRRALGQLLRCPSCLGVWMATSATAAMAVAPRPTRFAATALTVAAGADALNALHAKLSPTHQDGKST